MGKWLELDTEAFAHPNHPIMRAARGAKIIIRLNYIDAEDEMTHFDVLGGRLIRANRDEGFVISLEGQRGGEEFFLPLVPEAFELSAPGQYGLTCGHIMRDPDFVVAFDIYSALQ